MNNKIKVTFEIPCNTVFTTLTEDEKINIAKTMELAPIEIAKDTTNSATMVTTHNSQIVGVINKAEYDNERNIYRAEGFLYTAGLELAEGLRTMGLRIADIKI